MRLHVQDADKLEEDVVEEAIPESGEEGIFFQVASADLVDSGSEDGSDSEEVDSDESGDTDTSTDSDSDSD